MSRFLPSLLILSVLMAPLTSFAAPVSFKPVTLTQPDGSDVELFVSGDEFYHWVHDASGLPVVMDEDGWVVYVSERGDEPIPSGVPAGHPDPFLAGIDIEPGPPLTAGAIRDRIDRRRTVMSAPRTLEKRFGGPYRGTINQLVIFARFSDEPEFVDPTAVFDRMFNSDEDGVPSLDGYFNEVSYGRLRVQGHFFPQSQSGAVVSFQDSRPRSYYQPRSDRNPGGYEDEQSGLLRLSEMLDRAIKFIKPQVPADLDIDLDNDGFAENVVFIVSGDADDWANALWPHSYIMLENNYINGARLLPYNLQFRDWLLERSVGVLAHEFFHAIGAPDLYRYVNRELTPAGSWDLMEQNKEPPQHMTAWMKYRYGDFIGEPPVITEPGRYTLKPLSEPDGNVFQIPVPGRKFQNIVVEYRKQEGTYESSVPGSGLLVYRVDRLVNGNADGPPDELYIARPGGHPDVDGDIDSANMSVEAGRVRVDEFSDPYLFDQDGMPIPIRIYDVSEAGDTISFNVCPSIPDCIGVECGDDGCGGSCGSCDDRNPCTDDQCIEGRCVFNPSAIGTACDRGHDCSGQGECDGLGECVPDTPVACDDGNECTQDTCYDGGKWFSLGEDRFEDIMADGASAGVDGDDVVSAAINPGFAIPFMNGSYTDVFVYDNGLLTLGGALDPLAVVYGGARPGQSELSVGVVAPYYDDLECKLSDRCVVAWKVLGDAPDRRLVIQFNKAVMVRQPGVRVFFQVVLFEDGRIEFRYRDMAIHDGLRAAIGIWNSDGSDVLMWSDSTRSIHSGMTLAYSPDEMECVFLPSPGFCLIDGECVESGTISTENVCAECRPWRNHGGWFNDDSNYCTDSNACTTVDRCRSGVCEGTTPVVCKPINACHTAGQCDPATGVCGDFVKADGTLCIFDSNGCTVGDNCQGGECRVGSPPDCSAKNSECAVGKCVSRSSNSFRCDADTAAMKDRPCGAYESDCSGQDTCDARGNCVANDFDAGTVCRVADGECDLPDYCDGDGNCEEDLVVEDGRTCGWQGDKVCLSGMCVAPVGGDNCADAVLLENNQARRGTLAWADASAAAVAGCDGASGADVYYKVGLSASIGYILSVAPVGDQADFAFSLLDSCDQDDCSELQNRKGRGLAEEYEFSVQTDSIRYVRVTKLDKSDDLDFVISLRVAADEGEDLGGVDASIGDDGGEIGGGNGGCSQAGAAAGNSGILILFMLLVMVTGAFRVFAGCRASVRRG
ncbi:MAG TPA: M6 family metalloprotease domain-containing protein [Myxococcota bacterium]|nr:M6 family metalloprotease domain-containing protein [Myxococcota bacterium]